METRSARDLDPSWVRGRPPIAAPGRYRPTDPTPCSEPTEKQRARRRWRRRHRPRNQARVSKRAQARGPPPYGALRCAGLPSSRPDRAPPTRTPRLPSPRSRRGQPPREPLNVCSCVPLCLNRSIAPSAKRSSFLKALGAKRLLSRVKRRQRMRKNPSQGRCGTETGSRPRVGSSEPSTWIGEEAEGTADGRGSSFRSGLGGR